MAKHDPENSPKKLLLRALIEAGFIVLLFYSNLLMGEYVHDGVAYQHSFAWAVWHIFTWANFSIAIVAALIGYILVEVLRNQV